MIEIKIKVPTTVSMIPVGTEFENEFGSYTLVRKSNGGAYIRGKGKAKEVVTHDEDGNEVTASFTSKSQSKLVSVETPVDRIVSLPEPCDGCVFRVVQAYSN